MTSLRCPNCGRRFETVTAPTCRPFCSERCRLIDLGAWISEKHCIAGEPVGEDAGLSDWISPDDAENLGPTH